MSIDWGAIAQVLSPKKGQPTTFRYQGAGPWTTPGVSLAQWNAANVVVVPPSGSGVSADIHVQGNFVPGGFVDVPDPNGIVIGATSKQNIDVVVGALWIAVELSNMAGTFDAGQQWEVTITPCNLPGSRNRSNYYDRNPSIIAQTYNGTNVAPHVATTRWSYTVPVGRKAFIENGWAFLIRESAASPAAEAQASIDYTPNGGSIQEMDRAEVTTNGVLDHNALAFGSLATMLPGDNIIGATLDTSTGGTVSYSLAIKGIEFDY